jgi:ATP-dependent RNA helicase HelY
MNPDTSRHEPRTALSAFAATQPFALDRFQQEACQHLAEERSVLVSVPTGAGKTVILDFAVWLAQQRGRRAIVTTPLKALSNQKYYDLRRRWPGQVGLLTGDVSWHPEASILVMTTEVLRNRLIEAADLADVDQIVLDEAHFLADRERGTVWEEVILLAPPWTRLTALSATLPNADELAAWMTAVHGPTVVVQDDVRPVPLRSLVAHTVLGPYDPHTVVPPASRRSAGRADWHDLPTLTRELARQDLLPAIFFTFSRQRCEEQIAALVRSGPSLLSPEAQTRVVAAVEQALHEQPALSGCPTTLRWLDWLPWGAAPHHAGLLPDLKRLVEHLFQQNLLKVVAATETLAAGINMPARTVVISRLTKPSREGERLLSVAEFRQMSGRAGRRGLDPVGHVVLVPQSPDDWRDIHRLLTEPVEALWSQFRLTFARAAQLAGHQDDAGIRHFLDRSFAQYQLGSRRQAIEAQLAEVQRSLTSWSVMCPYHPEQVRAQLLGMQERAESRPDRRAQQSGRLNRHDSPCRRCRDRSDCQAGVDAFPGWVAAEASLERQRRTMTTALWQRFTQQRRVLRTLGCLHHGGLTAAGEVLARLRVSQDLTALFAWQHLADLTPGAVAAVASAVVGWGDGARRWQPRILVGPAREALDQVRWRCDQAAQAMRQAGMPDAPPWLDDGPAGWLERWAEGAEWAALIRESGIDEGEFVWHARQVIDLLWQYHGMPATPADLRQTIEMAVVGIDRHVVGWVEQEI